MKIFKEIEKYIEINSNEKTILLESLKLININKGDIIQEQDKSNDLVGFLEAGILRSYRTDKSGNDITYHFFEEGSFFTDLYSFDKSKKSEVAIEALSNCTIYTFDKKMFKELEYKIENWSCFALQYYQEKSSCLLNFNAKVKNSTAFEAYNLFSKYYKQAIKKSPQKHIASFLGMSKYTISRIRL